MPLNTATPIYPGDPHVEIEVANEFATANCLDHRLRLGTHTGTHIDAPGHMIEGGAMLDAYDHDRFVGRGCLIKLSSNEEPDLSGVRPGDIVLLSTGIKDAYQRDDYYDLIPTISLRTARALVDRKVKAVGIDAGSVDADPFPIHRTLLGGDVLIIENLIGLDQLEDVTEFEVIALPLRLQLEAAPARVFARY